MRGLTPIRTARLVSVFFALFGLFLLILEWVLSTVLLMAKEGVQQGLARYSNFTGRFAAANFAEDKKLLGLLRDVKGLLPTADTALTILLILGIVIFVVAILGFAFPRQHVRILVAVHLLKWEGDESQREPEKKIALTRTQKRVIVISVGSLFFVMGLSFGIYSCLDYSENCHNEAVIEKMLSRAQEYIRLQKSFFAKKKQLLQKRDASSLDLNPDEYFSYELTSSEFVAKLKKKLGQCPVGSRWVVKASTKGLFTKELQLSRILPANSACSSLTPDFKNLGRKNLEKK